MGINTISIEMSRSLSPALSSSKPVITTIDMYLRILFLRGEGPPTLATHADSHTFIQTYSYPRHRRALYHHAAPYRRPRCNGRCFHRPWPHADHHWRHVRQRHDDRLVTHQDVETKEPNDDNHDFTNNDDAGHNHPDHSRQPRFPHCRSVGVLLWNSEHHRPAQNGGDVPHHGH